MYLFIFIFLVLFEYLSEKTQLGVCLTAVYVTSAYHVFLGIYPFPATFVLTFSIMGSLWYYASFIDDACIVVIYVLSYFKRLLYILSPLPIKKSYRKHMPILLLFWFKEKKKMMLLYLNKVCIVWKPDFKKLGYFNIYRIWKR